MDGTLHLYRDPRPVHSRSHARIGVLTGSGDFAFAATAPVVEVMVDEFERAALDYPIVFVGEDARAYAVTSLRPGRNAFVRAGKYRDGAYVPAYLRRYPFAFARDADTGTNVLCLDHASPRAVPRNRRGAEPLFDGDTLTPLTLQAIAFCEQCDDAARRTDVLVALLREHDLLETRQSHYTPPRGGSPVLLLEFQTIAPERLTRLSDAAYLALRHAGALPAIYAQIASQAQWEVLGNRAAAGTARALGRSKRRSTARAG